MKTIIFFACKGGVGKTRCAVLTANYLARSGERTLVVDVDCSSNSATFYYLRDEDRLAEREKERNIANCLYDETNRLGDFILPSAYPGVDLVASDRKLVNCRAVEEGRLRRLLKGVADRYDYVVIDCQSDYNGVTLNAVAAADMIVTPLTKDLDSYNSAKFLDDKLTLCSDKRDAWFIMINRYDHQFREARGGEQREYVDLYRGEFMNLAPERAWYPDAVGAMNRIKDRHMYLAGSAPGEAEARRNAVINPRLYEAASGLAEFIVGYVRGAPTARPEYF